MTHLFNGRISRIEVAQVIIDVDGSRYWYIDGELHRTDGPAIIRSDGYQFWYQNGRLHRADGPAVIGPDGSEGWYLDDRLHREDGPAIIRPDGALEFWENGVHIRTQPAGRPI